jgi:ketosteroid isomerase-like protein
VDDHAILELGQAEETRVMQEDDRLELALQRFGEAWAMGETQTLEAMLSPTYTHTDAFGALQHRAAWLSYAAGRAGRTTQISFREVEVRRIGTIAIVTGINDITGRGGRNERDQKPLSIRFTQVWIFQDGKWLREAFQATPIQVPRAS